MQDLVNGLLWGAFFGWTGWVPFEVWLILLGIAALVILRFLGWPGIAAAVGAVAYYLGYKRGAGGHRPVPPQSPAQPRIPAPRPAPRRPNLLDQLRSRLKR